MTERVIPSNRSPQDNGRRLLEVLSPSKKFIFGETNSQGGLMVREMTVGDNGTPAFILPFYAEPVDPDEIVNFIVRTDHEYRELASSNGHGNGNGQKPKLPEQHDLFQEIIDDASFNR